MRIYVASSWRNPHQQMVVKALRKKGHDVYDFRNPAPGNTGFAWSSIDPDWLHWSTEKFREALKDPIAEDGFYLDMEALRAAEAVVLVLPCGRSAHLELGYAVGTGCWTGILMLEPNEPELMYKMTEGIFVSADELVEALENYDSAVPF
jgi:hypothetical protein